MSNGETLRVAVIGAGLSGTVAARYLCDHGCEVTLFDKSRGTGGRLASCRLGDNSVDLGLPFFESAGVRFNRWLERQVEAGILSHWYPSHQLFNGDLIESPRVYAATARMSALTRSLISDCHLISKKRISLVWPSREGISLRDEDNRLSGEFDAVLIATPAPQAVPLLDGVGRFRSRAAAVEVQPAWVTALTLMEPLNSPVELISGEHEVFHRLVRDSAKPGRQGADRWVLEARADWSRQHRRDSPDYVQHRMLTAFEDLLGPLPEISDIRTHRWLYSHTQGSETQLCLWGEDVCIGVCGDWFAGGGVEGAFESGLALAEKVMQSLTAGRPVEVEAEQTG
ncbi:NAD(P)/FAD-dependent oxidoreductase [Marinobacterium jannaschii]|uniref:NAD(P)/FAD-dependent oxidoreductase n=1 Tax=Marinobacterium jannaschii TaxID=64970 RepID=UPI0004811D09|nr:NAD(P)-binding protein [Marinobacterium jannaschii]